jgi:hypothetical protein
MAQPSASLFPNNIASAVVDLTTTSSITSQIFEFRESVVRALGAYGFFSVKYSYVEPVSPTLWDVWVSPGYFYNGAIVSANIRVWDGSSWIDMTPAVFASMIGGNTGNTLVSSYNSNTKITFTATGGIAIYVDGNAVMEYEPI